MKKQKKKAYVKKDLNGNKIITDGDYYMSLSDFDYILLVTNRDKVKHNKKK